MFAIFGSLVSDPGAGLAPGRVWGMDVTYTFVACLVVTTLLFQKKEF